MQEYRNNWEVELVRKKNRQGHLTWYLIDVFTGKDFETCESAHPRWGTKRNQIEQLYKEQIAHPEIWAGYFREVKKEENYWKDKAIVRYGNREYVVRTDD